ncbi:hypothetical protein L6452_08610 [Arctium lappa]|uniref:Uncharacterized protein n=1 Tax=Arctium lappa TaxID=4217 RepID=A0ACB9DIT3_ARCLA|nr:hypothetical protein L6452_08610 [Arctium lappa]
MDHWPSDNDCGRRSDRHRVSIRVDIEIGSHLLHGVLFENEMGLHISKKYLIVVIKKSRLINNVRFLVVVVDGRRHISLRSVGVEVERSKTMEDGWRSDEFRL